MKTENIIIRRKTLILILIISLVVQLIYMPSVLWLGNGKTRTMDEERQDVYARFNPSDIMTQAELSVIYAREHYLEFLLFEDNQMSHSEHWAAKQMHFFEHQLGMQIEDPDAAVTQEMLKAWYPEFKFDTTNVTRGKVMEEQIFKYAESFLGFYMLTLLLIVVLGEFKKTSYQIMINLIMIGAYATCMYTTISRVILFLLTGYTLIWIVKQRGDFSVETNKKNPYRLDIIGFLLTMGMASSSVILCGGFIGITALGVTIALYYLYIKLWKSVLVGK